MIFIVGMPRCGQRNILQAYKMLGRSSSVHEYVEGEDRIAEFEDNHFYAGNFINKEWQSLATDYPSSKFVVAMTEVYSWLYEIKSEERSKDKDEFEGYYDEVKQYFADKKNRCLTIENIAEENVIYRLAEFVGIRVPKEAHFPPLGHRTPPGFFSSLPNPGGFIERGERFLQARARWIKAGRPTRTMEQIAKVYDEVCQPCFAFDNDSCGVCGCRLKRDTLLINKLAWATEKCPLDPPKWDRLIEVEENEEEIAIPDMPKPPQYHQDFAGNAHNKPPQRGCCGG